MKHPHEHDVYLIRRISFHRRGGSSDRPRGNMGLRVSAWTAELRCSSILAIQVALR